MDTKIPEVAAREILMDYEGSNNQILDWKRKLQESKYFSLSRTQADYIIKYEKTTPKVAKKHVRIVSTFGEKLREDKLLARVPEQIWIEKLLCESDKAYHIWGKISETENMIRTARTDYNAAVQEYNLSVRKFPSNIFAGIFGFEKKSGFAADKGSEKRVNIKDALKD